MPWTKPEDIAYNRRGDLLRLGGFSPNIFLAALCDGSVRPVSQTIDKQVLRNLITISDGQSVRFDEAARPPSRGR